MQDIPMQFSFFLAVKIIAYHLEFALFLEIELW